MTRSPTPAPRDSVDAIIDGWRAVRVDLDVSPLAVLARLARIRAIVERETEALFAEHGLTSATFSALAAIERVAGEDGMSQVDLMRALRLTSGTVSVRVDRLVTDGLAERRPDPDDRRGARIVLTPRGRAAFEGAAPAHLDTQSRLLASLSPEDRERLAGLLRRLLVDLEGGADPTGDPPARLGLVLAPAHETARMRRAVGLPDEPGLLVRSVTPGGPAAAAEIETGDLITAIGDTPVFSACDLGDALTRVQAGGTLDLDVCRGTRRSSRTVTLR